MQKRGQATFWKSSLSPYSLGDVTVVVPDYGDMEKLFADVNM